MCSARTVIVHDVRLFGSVPRTSLDRLVTVNPHDTLPGVLARIRFAAQAQYAIPSTAPAAERASVKLTIMCHGKIAVAGDVGHYYLEIGENGLQMGNIAETRMLRGYFSKIIVKACGAVGGHIPVSPGILAGALPESQQLFAKLAKKTDTPVIASDTAQEYDAPEVTPHAFGARSFIGAIDFGAWEGDVYEYAPLGGRRRIR